MILKKELNLTNDEISEENINSLTSEYLNQVGNLTNFVSKMENEEYKIYIYKNISSLEDTAGEAPQIDFGECYDKVKRHYNIKEELLITLISNQTDKSIYGKASNKYSFSHPETGKVLNTTGIRSEDDKIIVKEDIKTLLENIDDKKEEYINFFVKQGVDIFNLSGEFYCDICYYFESPTNKDVPLKDRISSFYPNITLCDPGCENKGVDLEKMKVKCECIFNNLMNNNLMSNLYGGAFSEVLNIISSLNIEVFKCIRDIFKIKYFKKCIGGFIILILSFIQFISSFLFIKNGLYEIRRYIYSLIESFLLYKQNININNNPPKKKKIKKYRKKIKREELENYSINSKNKILNKSKNNNGNNLIFIKMKVYQNSKENNLNIFKNNNITDEANRYINIINEYLNNSFDENDFCDILDKETRTFGTYFCEKFKYNQIVLNTFCVNELFKPRTFKIILFLTTIELYFVINALFYNEEYLSELFNSNEPEHFFSFVPRRLSQFFYTSVVSIIISLLIGYFSIEEEKIKRIFIRFNKDDSKIKLELILILKDIKKRFFLFILLSFLLSIISFIYICCFNIVYPYIRVEWIKSSIFIFIVMQIINFLFTFLECCVRYIAIKCNSEKLFRLSLLLQ